MEFVEVRNVCKAHFVSQVLLRCSPLYYRQYSGVSGEGDFNQRLHNSHYPFYRTSVHIIHVFSFIVPGVQIFSCHGLVVIDTRNFWAVR